MTAIQNSNTLQRDIEGNIGEFGTGTFAIDSFLLSYTENGPAVLINNTITIADGDDSIHGIGNHGHHIQLYQMAGYACVCCYVGH